MKTITLAMCLSLAWLALPAAAQDAEKGERKAGRQAVNRMEQMAKDLNLTDEQKQKIGPLLREEAQKLRALRDDTSLDRRSRAAKVREVRTDLDTKLKPILNEEQWKKLEEQRAKARDEARAKKGRR